MQDVFYQFTRVNELVRPIEQTLAWLYRAARNRIIDKNRKKRDEPFPAVYDDDGQNGGFSADEYIFEEIAAVIYGRRRKRNTCVPSSLTKYKAPLRNCRKTSASSSN